MRSRVCLLLAICAFALAACDLLPPDSQSSPQPSPSPSSVGDVCLVGHWTLVSQQSQNPSGYLSGFAGAHMTIGKDGAERTDYTGSGPQTGTQSGTTVTVTRTGWWTFQDSAGAGTLIRQARDSALFETITYSGTSSTSRLTAHPVISYQYRCGPTELQTLTQNGATNTSSIDTWTRPAVPSPSPSA